MSRPVVHFGVNKERPGTWVRYRPELCNACQAACCTMPLEIKAADLVRLGLILEDDLNEHPKKIAAQLGDKLDSFRAKTGLFVMARQANGDCIFLDANRRCTVYEKRPQVCRDFPERTGSRKGSCPYIPKDTTQTIVRR